MECCRFFMSMDRQFFINGRFSLRQITGVERYAGEVTIRLGQFASLIRPAFNALGWRGLVWEQVQLPKSLENGGLLLSPANSGPISVRRQIVVLHDISPLEHPEWFDQVFFTWYRLLLPELAKRAVHLITVSNFSKQRICTRLGVHPDKVSVIPGGVNRDVFHPSTEEEIARVRHKYNLPSNYLLFLGSIEPRKNLVRLLKAWDRLSRKYTDMILVVIGKSGRVFRAVPNQNKYSSVMWLGYVPDKDLTPLLSGGTALIYPSLYEGFGLPVLEAMACGTPVVAGGVGGIVEVLGTAGLLCNPEETEDIATRISQVLDDSSLRSRMSDAGIGRVDDFSWDQTARMIKQVLEDYSV
jgi:glycosyltransferase involved in cell wall biosynthesis